MEPNKFNYSNFFLKGWGGIYWKIEPIKFNNSNSFSKGWKVSRYM